MDALIAVGSGAALVYGIYALIQIALAPTPEGSPQLHATCILNPQAF